MSKRFLHILGGIFLFLVSGQWLFCQNYFLAATMLETNNAIEANVSDFYKDSDGFMWMSSSSGVTRFDGHQFKVFNATNSKLRGISRNEVVEDDEGYIWVAGEKTIDLLHHETFEIIPFEEKFPDAPFEGRISFLRYTSKKEIFFRADQTNTFFSYHSKTGFQELDFIPEGRLTGFFPKENGVWTTFREGGRYKYEPSSGKLLESFEHPSAQHLYEVRNYTKADLFWTVKGNTLKIIRSQNNKVDTVFTHSMLEDINYRISDVHYLSQQDLFIIRINYKQFYILDLKTQQFVPIAMPEILEREDFRGGIVDDQDIIWISNRKNILLLQLNTNAFQQYPPFESTRGIWIQNKTLVNAMTKTKTDLQTGKVLMNLPLEFANLSVETSLKEELWIGGPKGLLKLDTSTFEVLEQFPSFINNGTFWAIGRNQKGDWWAGTRGRGILYKGKNEQAFYPFTQYNDFEQALSSIHFLNDQENVWAAAKNGLYLFHPQKGAIARYAQNAVEGFQIPFDNIHFIHKKGNEYWVASSNSGVIQLTLNEKYEITNLKHYTINDGLPSNTVYCILEDDKGRLWMSTFKGLVYFDSATENIQVFNQYDGLLETEFNRNSYAKDENGRIYFGSLRGVTAFYPDEIVRTSDLEQPILMTQFLVYKKSDNQWQDLTEQLNRTQKIVLDPSDRFFKLSVSLLDFFNAERLRYHYKIDGLLDDFQLIKGNQLEVSGLPYGKYKLRIKGQGADGRFSNQELVLPLIVKHPFYLSWWFFLLVFCSLMLALYQTYLWRTQQLSERQQELELLVQERTAKIAAQAEQLKELDQVKSKFFANISHELRTPLTLIIGPIKKLLGSNNLSNKEYTSVLLMQQNSQKLLKRINELLDLSRLNANKMEVHTTPTYLYPFLKNIIISIDSIANAKYIQIQFNYHLSEGLQILLDTDKMEKILYNYLSNALKFTPTNGAIRVLAERVEEQLQISVSDTGIGIPEADLTKVFDRFYQSRAKNGSQSRLNTNGTGIGLALCQELAKVLNGKVWATSKIGIGSTFFVQVPLTETFAIKAVDSIIEVERAIPILPKQTDFSANRASILVVEDNLDLRQYLQLILEEQYNVQLVEHGQAALDWLEKEEHPLPELILSDIMMPVMDGIELLSIIKSKNQFRHIPMIILTARQSMEVKLNALRIGIDDYLTKPFDNVELQTRVKNLIENSRSRSAQEPSQNEAAAPELSNTDLHWLEKVEQLILENVTESNFMLRDVATQMRMSYSGFRQRIKKITGLSPKQYERSIKLNKAREILKSGQVATVSEVLHQLGFDNHYHFSKIYKTEFGIMPSEELRG